jgi:hypothetical protein
MTSFFVLDVPENVPVVDTARDSDPRVTVTRLGPYFEVSSQGPIRVDRRAVGARHAVWYSAVAGLRAPARISQHDKDALLVEPA